MNAARKNRLRAQSTHSKADAGASITQLRQLLENAIDTLPDSHRQVFVLRDVEEMSIQEVAECLGISEYDVKMRLQRARARLRREVFARVGAESAAVFQFLGERRDRMVAEVMKRVRKTQTTRVQ